MRQGVCWDGEIFFQLVWWLLWWVRFVPWWMESCSLVRVVRGKTCWLRSCRWRRRRWVLRQSFLFRRCLHAVKRVWRRSSAGGRWGHMSALVREMVWRCVFYIAGTAGYCQIISMGTHEGIFFEFDQEVAYIDCEKVGERTDACGRLCLKVLEVPMEPLAHTLPVRYMYQEDSHFVKRHWTHIFDIFSRSPVLQTPSYAQLKSKKVATVSRRWVDWNPSEMDCDSHRSWSVVLRLLWKPTCRGMRVECSSSRHDGRLSMSLLGTFQFVQSVLSGGNFSCLLDPSPFWGSGHARRAPVLRAPAREPAAVMDRQ